MSFNLLRVALVDTIGLSRQGCVNSFIVSMRDAANVNVPLILKPQIRLSHIYLSPCERELIPGGLKE